MLIGPQRGFTPAGVQQQDLSIEFDLAPWIAPAVTVAAFVWLRSDIHRVEARMNARMDRLEAKLGDMRKELGAVVKDLAEMKGKLTFVEGYILRRNDAAPEPAE